MLNVLLPPEQQDRGLPRKSTDALDSARASRAGDVAGSEPTSRLLAKLRVCMFRLGRQGGGQG